MMNRVLNFLGDYLFEILFIGVPVGILIYGLVSLAYSIVMYLKL